MGKELKKNMVNLGIIFGMLLFLLFYIVKKEGIENIQLILKTIDYKPLSVVIFIMILYWFLEGLILYIYSKKYDGRVSLRQSIKTAMIGFFFSSITPFSSGGQPVQVYYMVKRGMRISDATSVLLSRFISYQISLSVLSLLLLKFQFSFFENGIQGFKILLFVGFSINVAVAIGLLIIVVSTPLSRSVSKGIILFLAKIKIIKNPTKYIEKANEEIIKLGDNINEVKKDKKLIIIVLSLTIIQFLVFFSVPYFIFLSFGMRGESIFSFIAAQAFVNLISAFIPLPGGSGGAEISFIKFFTLLFTGEGIGFAMLIWRLVTFYFTLIVSAFFLSNVFSKNEEKKGGNYDGK